MFRQDRIQKKLPHQEHFLERTDKANPVEDQPILGERTLQEVLMFDFPELIIYFWEKFHLPAVLTEKDLVAAMNWLESQKAFFDHSISEEDLNQMPGALLLLYETFGMRNAFLDGKAIERYPQLKPAHKPESKAWKDELDFISRAVRDKYTIIPRGGSFDSVALDHSSEIILRLTNLLERGEIGSAGDLGRICDLLVKELMTHYWLFLIVKAQKISEMHQANGE